MQNNVKLSLYLLPSNIDGHIPYSVYPSCIHRQESGQEVYDFFYDPRQDFQFHIQIHEHSCQQSFIQIVKIQGPTNDVTHTHHCYSYQGLDGSRINTYNWLQSPGKFSVKIRQSPHVHQYMMEFYRKCFKINAVDQ